MFKLVKYLKVFIISLIVVLFLVLIQTVVDLTLPAFMANIIDIGVLTGNINYIVTTGLKMLLISIIGGIATIGISYLAAKIGSRLAENIRRDIFAKVESFSLTEFVNLGISSLITRTTNDVEQVKLFFTIFIRIVLAAPFIGIGSIIRILNKSSSMSWIIIASLSIIVICLLVIFIVVMPKLKKLQEQIDRLNLVTRENLIGIRVTRAFNNEKYQEDKFDKANIEFTKTNLFINRIAIFFNPLLMIIMNFTMIAIIWIGASRINVGELQIGDMMAFLQYALQILMSFIMFSVVFILYPRASVSASRIIKVLEMDLIIKDKKVTKKPSINIRGNIEFKNVSFKYPDAQEKVLNNISFKVNRGETVAFIGSTGCGKSTLVNLIPRFFDVTEGSLLVDNVDVRDYNQELLRDKVSYVSQKSVLFKGTIESNIRYGNKNYTTEEVIRASKIAQAYDFIMQKEGHFKMKISQDGINLSGGQKQRIAIARALIKKADIYIFDDSFANLDFNTDRSLRKALNEELNEKTVLIVGQRISTIMNVNKIVVLEKGEIVGAGTHEELLNNCSVYKEIALSQLSKEELL